MEVLMARIKIKDLPKDQKISMEEMKRVLGGSDPYGPPRYPRPPYTPVRPGSISVGGGFGSPWVRVRRPLYEFPEESIPSEDW
jgi:hypothetical protein